MGTDATYPSGERFNKEEWNRVSSNPRCVVWENRRDSTQRIEQYNIPSMTQQEQKKQKEAYYLRKNHPQIVAALFFHTQDSAEFCSTSYQQDIFIEKIPIRLSDVEHIPYPDYLHLYHQCLYGYRDLANFFGFFHVEEDYIGINQRGIVKVWVNENYEVSYITGRRITQDEMVRSIIELVHNNLDFSHQNSAQVRNYLYRNNDKLNFKSAIEAFNQYLRNFCNNEIPQRLYCVDKVGIYTIANRQNLSKSQQFIQTHHYIQDTRINQSSFVRQDSRPRLAHSEIYKTNNVIYDNLTPRPQQITPNSIIVSNKLYQMPPPPEQIKKQKPLHTLGQSSAYILRPSTVKQNTTIIRKPSVLQGIKPRTEFQNRPMMVSANQIRVSANQMNSQPINNTGQINFSQPPQPIYIAQPTFINPQPKNASRSIIFQQNAKISQQRQPIPILNPNKYSIIDGIYPQNYPLQKRISNQVDVLSQSTHLTSNKVQSQSYPTQLRDQPKKETAIRNDFISLNRQDSRPPSNQQQRIVNIQPNIQPINISVQQNPSLIVHPKPPIYQNIQPQQQINQTISISTNNVFNKIEPNNTNLQKKYSTSENINFVRPGSANINQVKAPSQQILQQRTNSTYLKQNSNNYIPVQPAQQVLQPSETSYSYQKTSSQQNDSEITPPTFSLKQQAYNSPSVDYNILSSINNLSTKLNAREITSIDVQDGKSSQDFLKRLRQFSNVNNEKIIIQQEPQYLKRLNRQEYIFNTGLIGQNDKYSYQYPPGVKYSKEFQYGSENDESAWQYPRGVKYSKQFQYTTQPINYNSINQYEPSYQTKYQAPSQQQIKYESQFNTNQFNNKYSYTTSSNQSKIQSKYFNQHHNLQNSQEQLGKSTVSNIIQMGGHENSLNANTFLEPLKFEKDLEMKHSIFKADDFSNKYNKSYNSVVDDDLLADIKKMRESQLYQNK